jgi:hypothetical protein
MTIAQKGGNWGVNCRQSSIGRIFHSVLMTLARNPDME